MADDEPLKLKIKFNLLKHSSSIIYKFLQYLNMHMRPISYYHKKISAIYVRLIGETTQINSWLSAYNTQTIFILIKSCKKEHI